MAGTVSSEPRQFEAAAGLLRVRDTAAYEGQAPMLLEALAASAKVPPRDDTLAALVHLTPDGQLDPSPLINLLADEADAARGAALFHHAIADGLARWVLQAAQRTGLRTVALGGGCFLNALLSALLVPRLQSQSLRVIEARQAPPNDGGIALGQAWVGLCRFEQGE